jgi:hypothetical protein
LRAKLVKACYIGGGEALYELTQEYQGCAMFYGHQWNRVLPSVSTTVLPPGAYETWPGVLPWTGQSSFGLVGSQFSISLEPGRPLFRHLSPHPASPDSVLNFGAAFAIQI